jgi:cytochrome P450
MLASSLLFSDPPDHTRLRRMIGPSLSPRAVESRRPRIAAIVDAAFAALEPGAPVDVPHQLAFPIPLAVVCELLGADELTAIAFRRETPALVAALDPLADDDAVIGATSAALSLMLELVPLVAARASEPSNDLVTLLLGDGSPTGGLAVDETIMMLLLLLAAGHETTSTLMANAVVTLSEHPDLIHQLRAQPNLIPAAVEELLRFESPVQLVSRTATQPTQVGGTAFGPGDQALICIGAVNRDPAVFTDPDEFVLGRGSPHLAFGHGIHFCAGAALARVESQEMLRQLVSAQFGLETRQATFVRDGAPTFRRLRSLTLSPSS